MVRGEGGEGRGLVWMKIVVSFFSDRRHREINLRSIF